MSNFVYTPEGAEPMSWPWEPDRLMNDEAEAIERATGLKWSEFKTAIRQDSVIAIHGLLWVMLRREVDGLKYHEVKFSMSEISFELDDDEWAAWRDLITAGIRRGEQVSDEYRKLLDEAISHVGPAPEAEDDDPADAGPVEPLPSIDGTDDQVEDGDGQGVDPKA